MKAKIFLTSLLMLGSINAHALVGNLSDYVQYSNNKALNNSINGTTTALERAGMASTSASSYAIRSNLARAVKGLTGGWAGLALTVGVGVAMNWPKGSVSSNPDGTINLTNDSPSTSLAGPFVPGMTVWTLANSGAYTGTAESSSIVSLIPLYIEAQNKNVLPSNAYYVLQLSDCAISGLQFYCQTVQYTSRTMQNRQYVGYQTNAKNGCGAGGIFNGTTCIPDPLIQTVRQTRTMNLSNFTSSLSASDRSSVLTPQQQSDTTNVVLQSLNNQGYQNAPMTTAEDFANMPAATVEDATTPINDTNLDGVLISKTSSKAIPTSSTSTSTTTTTDAATGATTTTSTTSKTDLGSDPGIASPTLDATPTAESILDPIFNMMPRTTTIHGATGTCPSPTIILLGHSFNFNLMCSILNSQASVISGVMLFGFTVKTILIILSA